MGQAAASVISLPPRSPCRTGSANIVSVSVEALRDPRTGGPEPGLSAGFYGKNRTLALNKNQVANTVTRPDAVTLHTRGDATLAEGRLTNGGSTLRRCAFPGKTDYSRATAMRCSK